VPDGVLLDDLVHYYDAIHALPPDDRMRLLTMAALGAPKHGFSTPWILGELLEHGDVTALPAFRRCATIVDTTSAFQQDATACYVLGLKGCSRYLDQPPAPNTLETDLDRAWHAWGAILFWLYKPDLSLIERRAAAAQWWGLLHSRWPREAAGLLVWLDQSHVLFDAKHRPALDEICSVFPDDVRTVLEFGLVNLPSLIGGTVGVLSLRETPETFIRWLGVVGNRQTVKLLGQLVDAPELGTYTVEVLRNLDRRHFGA
jgi:hypothetical protein